MDGFREEKERKGTKDLARTNTVGRLGKEVPLDGLRCDQSGLVSGMGCEVLVSYYTCGLFC